MLALRKSGDDVDRPLTDQSQVSKERAFAFHAKDAMEVVARFDLTASLGDQLVSSIVRQPGPLDAEIRGDWTGFKGQHYHVLYALWLLLVDGKPSVEFYAGNDLFAHTKAPSETLPSGEGCGIVASQPDCDDWIQVKNEEGGWSPSQLLDDTIVRTFVWNAIVSRTRGRNWRAILVSPGAIDSGAIKQFLANTASQPKLQRKLETVRQSVLAGFDDPQQGVQASLPKPTAAEIDALLREVLGQLAENQSHTVRELIAEIHASLVEALLGTRPPEQVLSTLIGTIVEAARTRPTAPLQITIEWLESQSGHQPLDVRKARAANSPRCVRERLLGFARNARSAQATLDRRLTSWHDAVDRTEAARWLSSALRQHTAQRLLLLGPAGGGKTTWVINRLHHLAQEYPTVWSTARRAHLDEPNAIERIVCRALAGREGDEVALRLQQELWRAHASAVVILDGIDELRDLRHALGSIHDLARSPLDKHCIVLMTCRSEAFPLLRRVLTDERMELFASDSGTVHRLAPLSLSESENLLRRWKVPASDRASALDLVPQRARGNPLFLSWAVQRLKDTNASTILESTDLAQAHVDWCIGEVQRLLSNSGTSPSKSASRVFLESIARHLSDRNEEVITVESMAVAMGNVVIDDGEGSLLERCVQVGLLVPRSDGYAFTHPLFQDEFLARAVEREYARDWPRWVQHHDLLASRGMLTRLAARLSNPWPLVRALTVHDDRVAAECAIVAAASIEPETREELLTIAQRLLESRYTEERSLAINLMGALRHRKAGSLLVAWFLALPREDQTRFANDVGRALVAAEGDESGFFIVMSHSDLLWERYSSRFAVTVEQSSAPYRTRLGKWLLEKIPYLTPEQRESAITMLAILRHECLLDLLQEASDARELQSFELHALVHLDTDASLALYESCLRQLSRRVGPAPEHGHINRRFEDDVVFPDEHAHTHESLERLVGRLLIDDDAELGQVAARWAMELRSTSLLAPYVRWLARHPLSPEDALAEMASHIPPSDVAAVLQSFDGDSASQCVFLRALTESPSEEVERLLLSSLGNESLLGSAAYAAGQMRLVSAEPILLRALAESNDARVLRNIIDALGSLGLQQSLPPLASYLRPDRDGGPQNRIFRLGFEPYVVSAIASIGGNEAVSVLKDFWPRAQHPDLVVWGLIRDLDPIGCRFVADESASHPDMWRMILRALWQVDSITSEPGGESIPIDLLERSVLFPVILNSVRENLNKSDSSSARKESNDGRDREHGESRALRPADAEFALHSIRVEESLTRSMALGAVRILMRSRRPEATELVQRLLSDVSSGFPLWGMQLTALTGDHDALKKAVCHEMEVALGHSTAEWSTVERLRRFPRAVVRAEIYARMAKSAGDADLVWLLQWFVDPTDRPFFVQMEDSENDRVADVAHSALYSWTDRIRDVLS